MQPILDRIRGHTRWSNQQCLWRAWFSQVKVRWLYLIARYVAPWSQSELVSTGTGNDAVVGDQDVDTWYAFSRLTQGQTDQHASFCTSNQGWCHQTSGITSPLRLHNGVTNNLLCAWRVGCFRTSYRNHPQRSWTWWAARRFCLSQVCTRTSNSHMYSGVSWEACWIELRPLSVHTFLFWFWNRPTCCERCFGGYTSWWSHRAGCQASSSFILLRETGCQGRNSWGQVLRSVLLEWKWLSWKEFWLLLIQRLGH